MSYWKEDAEAIPAIIKGDVQPTGYTLITDPDEIKVIITSEYKQHTFSGIEYFEKMRASLAYDAIEGTITFADAFYIEGELSGIKANVVSGDWKTAQYNMGLITPSGALTQGMYDDILGYIDQYIIDNY